MKFSYYLCASVLVAGCATAQTGVRIDPATGGLGWLTHPYQTRSVPPVSLSHSSRLDSLVRAGISFPTAEELESALIGGDVTGMHGRTTLRGVLTMLADGLEWREIRQAHAGGKGG